MAAARPRREDIRMAYPTPLSERTLKKQYADTGLPESTVLFAKDFCSAAANLYGAIMAQDLWYNYREYAKYWKVPPMHKRDLFTLLKIFRRESVSFYVYAIDELYSEELPDDKLMVIAAKELEVPEKMRFRHEWIYGVLQKAANTPWFLPENLQEFLSYKDNVPSTAESKILKKLGALKSTEPTYENPYTHENLPCRYTGKRLSEIVYISDEDQRRLDYLSGKIGGKKPQEKKFLAFEASLTRFTAPERLLHDFSLSSKADLSRPLQSAKTLTLDLEQMGVILTSRQLQEFISLLMDYHNNLHLWVNAGWTPNELSQYRPSQPSSVEHPTDREAVLQDLKDRGYRVE